MSEYDAWDFQDEDDDEQPIDPRSLPKQLRRLIKDAKAEAKAAKEEAATLRQANREYAVGQVLTSKGVPEKVAKLIPGDVSTPEAIETWLGDYGDLFGSPSPTPATTQATNEGEPSRAQQFIDNTASNGGLSAEEIANQQRMQATAATAQPFGGKADELLAKLNDPNLTEEQLTEMIAQGGL